MTSPILSLINETSRLGQELLTVIKRESETVSGNNGVLPPTILAAKTCFHNALAKVFDEIRADASALAGIEEMRAITELQKLIELLPTAALDHLIEDNPETVEFCYERAGILLKQGHIEAAHQDLLTVINQDPKHFDALTTYAMSLRDSKQYEAAQVYFLQAITAHPKNIDGHLNFADFLLSQSDYDHAQKHYQQALALDPNLNAAQQGLTLAQVGLGDEKKIRELILQLQQAAKTLQSKATQRPIKALEAEELFLAALSSVLEQAANKIANSTTRIEAQAFLELQALLVKIRTTPLDKLIEIQPNAIEYRYKRAGILFNLGQEKAASIDYLAVLSAEPTHFGALNHYGILLLETGESVAAHKMFSQAVQFHPNQALGHLNLANLLLAQNNYEAAKSHYHKAIQIEPHLAKAHQGLAHAYFGLGEEAEATVHRDLGYREQALVSMPFRGKHTAEPLLIFSSTFGGNVPIQQILDGRIFKATVVFTEYYDAARPLPAHRLIVNLIGDADLSQAGLTAAETLLANSTAAVINHPARVRPTGRLNNARRLGALPDVRTPRMASLARTELLAPTAVNLLAEYAIGFPVLLRCPGFQTGQHFIRVETPSALAPAVSNLPGQNLLVMELLDSRSPQGDHHKFRVMFVDGALYPLHLAISKHWKVHYFSADMEIEAGYRKIEEAFLNDMPTFLGDKAMKALDSIQRELGLDYGGIDFALTPNGEVLLFEANATMVVHRPENIEKWAYRQAAAERILEAIRAMLLNRIDRHREATVDP